MRYKTLIVSFVASSLLWGAEGVDKEYQVNFTGNTGTYKQPTFSPNITTGKDFSWNQSDGLFVLGKPSNKRATIFSTPPDPTSICLLGMDYCVTATFQSDGKDQGILTLKDFSFVNASKTLVSTGRNGGIVAPKEDDIKKGNLATSQMFISNSNSNNFKGFVLGGGSSGVNLYSGSNLVISGFGTTTLQGSINVYSGKVYTSESSGTKVRDGGYLSSSLSIDLKNQDYSTLNLSGDVYLNTDRGSDRTVARSEASFNASVKGNMNLGGQLYVGDKAKSTLEVGNTLKLNGTVRIEVQEMKKITQDAAGNQSIADEDYFKAKMENLTITAPQIVFEGRLDAAISTKPQSMETETKPNQNGSTTITTIKKLPTDIGTTVTLDVDINKKNLGPNANGTVLKTAAEKPKDWKEVTKAQFLGSSSSSINIGKNSDVKLITKNNEGTSKTSVFTEEDKYAITLGGVVIQDQNKDNQLLNLDLQAQVYDPVTTTTPLANGKQPSAKLDKNSGKILLQGKMDFGENARAKIQSYDGIDLGSDARFELKKDSLLWLSVGDMDFNVESKGEINLKGGAMVFGGDYQSKINGVLAVSELGNRKVGLKNSGKIILSSSQRSTTESIPPRPTPQAPQEKEGEKPKPLDPAGLFLLGATNTLNNEGSIIFDGGGNLTTMKRLDDKQARDLSIVNETNKKGNIEAKGANNTIASAGNITLSSQDISISEKILDEKDPSKKEDGELWINSYATSSNSTITLGSQTENSGRDRVTITGGVFGISSESAGVKNYNLRITNATMDLSKLSNLKNQTNQQDDAIVEGSGAFVNLRRLELGGNAKVILKNTKGAFVNGEVPDNLDKPTSPNDPKPQIGFKKDLATLEVQGHNSFVSGGDFNKSRFGLDNFGNIKLKSFSSLSVEGDLYNRGTLLFAGDRFGVGYIGVRGKVTFDMSDSQDPTKPTNPLIAINHENFYSLTLNEAYLLLSAEEIVYRVGSAVIDTGSSGNIPSPRLGDEEDTLTYGKQQGLLKTQIEDYLNGVGIYEGNENKLGVFLKGVALVTPSYVGFGVTRSEAISQIKVDGTPTGVIDQYLDILSKSDGEISKDKTRAMSNAIGASGSRAKQVLNNALEAQNALELGILRDIGSYNTNSLIALAKNMDDIFKSVANLSKPIYEDFSKMQIVREIAVQNRLTRASNPFTAEIELARVISEISKYRYASNEVSSDVKSDVSPNVGLSSLALSEEMFANVAYKSSVWLSAISSTTKEINNSSALYGFSAGYEYMPISNVLLGIYGAYGYSNFKSTLLENNAHNFDLNLYTRLYYESSELDMGLGYLHGSNTATIKSPVDALNQSAEFGSDIFELSLKYGYVLKIPRVKGLFIKPQVSYNLYAIALPEITTQGSNPIVLEKKMLGGMSFGLGAEARQYVSAFSYLYLLPSFEFNLFDDSSAVTYFRGASNKLVDQLDQGSKYLFSIYAGGEGFVSPNFSINLSAGYKAGLDKTEHNLSISAGLKYKF